MSEHHFCISQYNVDPFIICMHATKCLLQYLKGSINLRIMYFMFIRTVGIEGIKDLKSITYTDVSYMSNLNDIKFITG
jgi:hypothetical protein